MYCTLIYRPLSYPFVSLVLMSHANVICQLLPTSRRRACINTKNWLFLKTQRFINTFPYWWTLKVGYFNIYWFLNLTVSDLLNQCYFLNLFLFIIIEDLHQFIVYCIIPSFIWREGIIKFSVF